MHRLTHGHDQSTEEAYHAAALYVQRRLAAETADDYTTEIFAEARLGSETEMLVVELPHGHGLRSICSALLSAEISLEYVYPLLVRPTGRAALAIHTDDLETAALVLKKRRCKLLSEDDLGPGPAR